MPSSPPPLPSPCCGSPSRARLIISSISSSPPSSILYSAPRIEKYTSKMVSKAFQCALFFTRVAPRAYLNASRSSSGMCWSASMASRFSVRLTGRPAARSSWMKPARRSIIALRAYRSAAAGAAVRVGRQLLLRLGDVALVLEQDVQGLLGLLGVDVLDSEQHQGAGPVDRLRHRRVLLQLQRADRPHDAHDLVGQVLVDTWHPGLHDLLLAVELRVVDMQIETAPLQG